MCTCACVCVCLWVRACMCVCGCVCVCPPEAIVISSGVIGMIWTPYDWLNKCYSYCMYCGYSWSKPLVGVDLQLKHIVESKPANKGKLTLHKPWIHFYKHVNQLHISNKTERFSYKGGCGVRLSRHLKEELAGVQTNMMQLLVNSNIMLFKTDIPLRSLRLKPF